MNKADLAAAVHGLHGGVSRAEAARIVDTIFESARELLAEEGALRIRNFGALEVRRRGPRRGGDPRTGRPFLSAPRRAPFFRPARALRESLETRP